MKEEKEQQKWVQSWPMIPSNAFLFFPSGEQIKSGEKEKGWRKIFESGDKYDDFQQKNIQSLDEKIEKKNIQLHPWFNRGNKLRFLQANKFKISDTVKSIEVACKWRKDSFPVKITDELMKKLEQGCFYFCGRDYYFRPILVADIAKFKQGDQKIIPSLLMIILEYMLDQLLIQGQVENYVMILDLETVSMDMKNTVMEIVKFTSNTYRSRLFASYLLGMPTMLNFAWNSLASAFVSQNTLRKIKISKKMRHQQMWLHIDRAVIQQRYGGQRPKITTYPWPPSKQLLISEPKVQIPGRKLISQTEYNRKYHAGQLCNRKVNKNLITIEEQQTRQITKPISAGMGDEQDLQMMKIRKDLQTKVQQEKQKQKNKDTDKRNEQSKIKIQTFGEIPIEQTRNDRTFNASNTSKSKFKQKFITQDMIRDESLPPIKQRNFELFFEDEDFLIAVGLIKPEDRKIQTITSIV